MVCTSVSRRIGVIEIRLRSATSPSDLMLLFLRFSVGEDRACCSASSASLVFRSRGFGVCWFLCELCVGSCVDSGSPAV